MRSARDRSRWRRRLAPVPLPEFPRGHRVRVGPEAAPRRAGLPFQRFQAPIGRVFPVPPGVTRRDQFAVERAAVGEERPRPAPGRTCPCPCPTGVPACRRRGRRWRASPSSRTPAPVRGSRRRRGGPRCRRRRASRRCCRRRARARPCPPLRSAAGEELAPSRRFPLRMLRPGAGQQPWRGAPGRRSRSRGPRQRRIQRRAAALPSA